jgi:dehydratase
MRTASLLRRAPFLLAAAAATGALVAGPAAAADTSVNLACQATPPIVAAQNFSLSESVNATAPASVASGSTFTIVLAPGALTVPSSVSGYTVKSISNLKLTVQVPANATLTGESLQGGSGLGSGKTSVAASGGNVTISVPGPINGGSTFTLPTLTLTLKAGASGTTVQSTLGGTSYSSPGLTFTASVPILFINASVPTACYPSPSPVLSSTSVS